MAYNFSFKRYANGTIQLTYYDYPIMDEYDKYCASYNGIDSELDNTVPYYDDCWTPWGYADDCETFQLEDKKNDDKLSVLSDEELSKRHERSVESSLNRSIRRIYDLGRNNTWDWFFTFTLNEKAVKDRKDFSECSRKINIWFSNLRIRLCPNIKYLVVPERHPTSGAWHFHALVSNCPELEFKVAINNQEFRKDKFGDLLLDKNGQPKKNKYYMQELRVNYPDGNYIYNIVNFSEERYGFSQATKIVDTRKVVSYIVKYLTKELSECTFGKKRYFASKNLVVPERETMLLSKASMSDVIQYIEKTYNVKFSADYMKTVYINQEKYNNTVSYLEFDSVSQKSYQGNL